MLRTKLYNILLFLTIFIGIFNLVMLILLLTNRYAMLPAGRFRLMMAVMLLVNAVFSFAAVLPMLDKRSRLSGDVAEQILEYYDKEPVDPSHKLKKLLFMRSFSNDELAREMLETEAKLSSLQTQINPHFLYNTLETIRSKAISNGENDIAVMIETLARLFQYNIGTKEESATLAEELESVKNFVFIQNYRFQDKFTLDIDVSDISEMVETFRMPFLCLQPLVENAIHHGLEKKVGPGLIRIKCFRTQNRLIITVMDDGVGMSREQLEVLQRKLDHFVSIPQRDRQQKKGSGIALLNVHQRIKLFYGSEYGLNVISAQEVGTRVELALPVEGQAAHP